MNLFNAIASIQLTFDFRSPNELHVFFFTKTKVRKFYFRNALVSIKKLKIQDQWIS